MESNSRLVVQIGIFFTIAVVILVGLSFQVTNGFFADKQYEIVANFRQSYGVDKGTTVALRGVPIGTVSSLDWDASKFRVRMIFKVDERYSIPRNAVAKVQMGSLLGGNFVNILVEEGPEEMEYLARGDEITTLETLSLDEVVQKLSDLSTGAEDLIANLDANQEATMKKIQSVIDENRAEFRQTSESFARLGPKLETLADDLSVMTAGVKDGQGTLGGLYADDQLYLDIKEFAEMTKDVTAQIRSGEGSLGRMIYGEEFATEAEKVMADLQRAAKEVEAAVFENREGFRDLVASLSDSGPKLEQAINDLNDVANKINAGEGTLGRLVNDPSLYDDAKRTVNQVGESFESAEEQGVFRSFLGLLFGALI